MARNRKPEYINRLRHAEAPNGFKFDIANYLYNPDLEHDYPHFIKTVAEDEETEKIKGVYFMKYYDGAGARIGKVMRSYKDADGQTIRYAEYYLEREAI